MAIAGSGLFCASFVSALNGTIVLNLDLETHKGALFTNAITPNYTTDTAYGVGSYSANEAVGTNWATGGVALTGTTVTATAGTVVFDATDVSVANTTLSGIRGYLLYADALAGNNAILLVDLLADFATVAGTFQITWSASGLAVLDLVP